MPQTAVVVVSFLVISPRLQERGGGGKMALIVMKAVLRSSKPPAVDDSVRTSRCGFGASAPSLTRASLMHYSAAGGSAVLPKLVKLVGPSSSLAEELS